MDQILLVIACLLLFAEAVGFNPTKVSFGWLGLALFVLTFVI